MKKFVSLAMVAAMTASMVPATAFAGDDMDATAKVVNVKKVRNTEVDTDAERVIGVADAPELHVKLTSVAAQGSGSATSAEFTVTLDGAEFDAADEATINANAAYTDSDNEEKGTVTVDVVDTDEMKVTVALDAGEYFVAGDVVKLDLVSTMEKAKDAFVSVESDDFNISNEGEDMVYVDVADEGITASVKKLATVAEEEVTKLEKDLKIESNVGDFVNGQEIELKLSNGFEFAEDLTAATGYTVSEGGKGEKTAVIVVNGDGLDEIVIPADNMEIEAVSAKEGTVAVLTVKAKSNPGFKATTTVEVAEVKEYTVELSVDEDMDVPVMYSGVDSENRGITDDSDHLSLEVTIEETFPGAWSMHKAFRLDLPEGVYVVGMEEVDDENETLGGDANLFTEFENAYQEDDHKGFEFKKRTFEETNPDDDDECHEMTFKLKLVADPGFVGDVDLKLTGDAVEEQEVTIATFATPYYVKAEQNDLKIDYRYTEVPSTVEIVEAEAGLWADEVTDGVAGQNYFTLFMDHTDENFFAFEDADVVVDEESGMEIDADVNDGSIVVELEEESDEAATITISNMEMFMSRSIPAGPYDLEAETLMAVNYMAEELFAPDLPYDDNKHDDADFGEGWEHDPDDCDEEVYVGCVADFSSVVKEAFINVVTAGREQDDASFTTKVVVPVGESYIVAGETQVSLDVPAYVSEAGYTMLPVRAVATALGISNNNVIWNGESKTVTILYGQRIITMVAGQKTVNVNGSVIPASAAVEIVDGRTFLPMRDLATALGVTDITWDAATKTATLNGGVQ